MVSSTDSGSFSPGPKIFGKKEGRRRPRAKLASVTVRGPSEENHTGSHITLIFFHAPICKLNAVKLDFHPEKEERKGEGHENTLDISDSLKGRISWWVRMI